MKKTAIVFLSIVLLISCSEPCGENTQCGYEACLNSNEFIDKRGGDNVYKKRCVPPPNKT